MAREESSERGLPSAEVRRQILDRAGIILNEARDLLARLDRHEASFPTCSLDYPRLELLTHESFLPAGSNRVTALSAERGHSLAA